LPLPGGRQSENVPRSRPIINRGRNELNEQISCTQSDEHVPRLYGICVQAGLDLNNAEQDTSRLDTELHHYAFIELLQKEQQVLLGQIPESASGLLHHRWRHRNLDINTQQ
jgi:hypothetical protein